MANIESQVKDRVILAGSLDISSDFCSHPEVSSGTHKAFLASVLGNLRDIRGFLRVCFASTAI